MFKTRKSYVLSDMDREIINNLNRTIKTQNKMMKKLLNEIEEATKD